MRGFIHLWIYNHTFAGISDQLEFFVKILKDFGYGISVSKLPKKNSLNFVIENFCTLKDRKTLIDFCTSNRKKVSVIMTEHLDFINNSVYFHGKNLTDDNDYMGQATKIQRVLGLVECSKLFNSLVTLGDLPYLKGIDKLLVNIPIYRLPFPSIKFFPKKSDKVEYDFLFIGALTSYRKGLIRNISKFGFSVRYPNFKRNLFISRKLRNHYLSSSRVSLNIPQVKNWSWLSTMRIIVSLANGKPTLSMNSQDFSTIHSCVYQTKNIFLFDKKNTTLLLKNWFFFYKKSYLSYMNSSNLFKKRHPFFEKFLVKWYRGEVVLGK